MWFATGYFLYDNPDKGQLGDMFGSINALFSGLAFSGVIYAILLQREELELQRKELELTRKELSRTADAAQNQVKHFKSQKKREDIYKLISKLTDRINNNYNSNRLDFNLSFHGLMLGTKDVNSDTDFALFYNKSFDSNSDTYRTIKYLESDLTKLMFFLDKYERATGKARKTTPFPDFYRAEYKELVETMHKYALIKKELFDYYCTTSR